ncbi:MAG: GNAT family N-acetyltransferase [bacterium]|nr:GNAT family N-acetyltransferase [bacterium]
MQENSDLPGLPGFRLREFTSAQLAQFTDMGAPTCAFMHCRPDSHPEKFRQDFSSFIRDYAFTSESEIHFVESPEGVYAAQIWLHSIRNVFNRRSEMWIWDLTVGEGFRGKGIGRALLNFARDRAVAKKCAELWLLVSSANSNALRLYESFGLKTSGRLMSMEMPRTCSAGTSVQHDNSSILRPLTPCDSRSLYRLWERAELPYKPSGRDREDRLSRHLSSVHPGGWGCFVENDLAAAALISYDGRKGWIERLATDPNHRRVGLAKAIIMAARQSLIEQGALVIGALIENGNVPSRRLFEACGFIHQTNCGYFTDRTHAGA